MQMNLWLVEHFLPHFLSGSVLILTKSEDKSQRFICTQVTFYKFHILDSDLLTRATDDLKYLLWICLAKD